MVNLSNSFNISSAKSAFNNIKQTNDAGDYIINLKAKTSFCNSNPCFPNKYFKSQDNFILQKKAYLFCNNYSKNFNKTNLYINLYTKLDLSGVPVISDLSSNITPEPINYNDIQYLKYNIDPSGLLFGNNICGINNYIHYVIPNTNITNI
jgi:hypothetical protein